jgi:hypothetical protein
MNKQGDEEGKITLKPVASRVAGESQTRQEGIEG